VSNVEDEIKNIYDKLHSLELQINTLSNEVKKLEEITTKLTEVVQGDHEGLMTREDRTETSVSMLKWLLGIILSSNLASLSAIMVYILTHP